MVKYLFSDIDGTLLKEKYLDKETINKINQFIQEGNKFYCVTGRIDEHIKIVEDAIGIRADYRISQNGCVIYDKNDNLIYQNTMDIAIAKSLASFLYEMAHKYGFSFGVSELNGKRYFTSKYDIVDDLFKDRIGEDITPILYLLIDDSEDNFSEVREHIEKHYKNQISCVLTSFGIIEILPLTASKAHGINLVLQREGIDSKDIYVVGDNENDICMFNTFENGFSMVNAKDNIKDHTKYSVSEVGDLIDFITKNSTSGVDKIFAKYKNKSTHITNENVLKIDYFTYMNGGINQQKDIILVDMEQSNTEEQTIIWNQSYLGNGKIIAHIHNSEYINKYEQFDGISIEVNDKTNISQTMEDINKYNGNKPIFISIVNFHNTTSVDMELIFKNIRIWGLFYSKENSHIVSIYDKVLESYKTKIVI